MYKQDHGLRWSLLWSKSWALFLRLGPREQTEAVCPTVIHSREQFWPWMWWHMRNSYREMLMTIKIQSKLFRNAVVFHSCELMLVFCRMVKVAHKFICRFVVYWTLRNGDQWKAIEEMIGIYFLTFPPPPPGGCLADMGAYPRCQGEICFRQSMTVWPTIPLNLFQALVHFML
jgi:hypothetical protein